MLDEIYSQISELADVITDQARYATLPLAVLIDTNSHGFLAQLPPFVESRVTLQDDAIVPAFIDVLDSNAVYQLLCEIFVVNQYPDRLPGVMTHAILNDLHQIVICSPQFALKAFSIQPLP